MDDGGTDAIRGPRGKAQEQELEDPATLKEPKHGGAGKWSRGQRRG